MKVVVFGASGGTGREIVRAAIAAGHDVTAFVRNQMTMASFPEARVVHANALDAVAVATAIEGQDAVLSALGSRSLKKSDVLDRASANIISAMDRYGVRRLIVLGAAGALHDALRYQTPGRKLFFKLISNTLLKNALDDSAAQERRIEASDLDYTIVHPPRLTDEPATGRYRIERDGLPPRGNRIARADVAAFMVAQIADRTFVRAGPYLAD